MALLDCLRKMLGHDDSQEPDAEQLAREEAFKARLRERCARLMMNPSFIARSYFPTGLLRSTGLEPIGSRTVRGQATQAWTRKGQPQGDHDH